MLLESTYKQLVEKDEFLSAIYDKMKKEEEISQSEIRAREKR